MCTSADIAALTATRKLSSARPSAVSPRFAGKSSEIVHYSPPEFFSVPSTCRARSGFLAVQFKFPRHYTAHLQTQEDAVSKISLKVNGKLHTVELEPETPLLYVLSDEIGLRGPKFGCGMAQC